VSRQSSPLTSEKAGRLGSWEALTRRGAEEQGSRGDKGKGSNGDKERGGTGSRGTHCGIWNEREQGSWLMTHGRGRSAECAMRNRGTERIGEASRGRCFFSLLGYERIGDPPVCRRQGMILLSNGEEALEAGQNAETRRRCPIPQDDACAEYATDSILRIRDGLALVRELTIRIREIRGALEAGHWTARRGRACRTATRIPLDSRNRSGR